MESFKIEIKSTPYYTHIVGSLENVEIIVIDITELVPKVGMSTCLSSDYTIAKDYLFCMNQTIAFAERKIRQHKE